MNLSSVKIDHLRELVEIQENLTFKLIRNVKVDDVAHSRFSKMKVNKSK